MLNVIVRPVATPPCTRWFRLAAPLACAWILTAPAAQAVETVSMPMEATASMPFNHYQNWRDEPLQDWREVNARVGKIGGWLTYLREAQQDSSGTDPSGQGQHDHHGH